MDLARFTAGDLEAASGTYGGHVRARPRAVVRPRSVDEVLELIRIARREGLTIGARGQGHSTGGQPLVPDGLVVETGELAQIGEIDDEAVWVGAGATWRQVVAATLPRGLAPPVLNDYLGLSVGGTLSVGGVGMASFRHGAQVDQVRELDVVTGAGELVRCSAVRERELFDAVRAGLGQVGIIVAARLAVTPSPTHVEVRNVHLRDVAQMMELARRDDVLHLRGEVGDDVRVTVAQPTRRSAGRWVTPFTELIHRLDRKIARAVSRPMARPWLDLFVPATGAAALLAELRGLGEAEIMVYPLRRSRCRAPLLRLPDAEELLLVDLMVETPGSGAARRCAGFRASYERLRDRGATLYPIGSLELDGDGWRRHYGEAWDAFAAARARYVPDGRLGPGPGIFA